MSTRIQRRLALLCGTFLVLFGGCKPKDTLELTPFPKSQEVPLNVVFKVVHEGKRSLPKSQITRKNLFELKSNCSVTVEEETGTEEKKVVANSEEEKSSPKEDQNEKASTPQNTGEIVGGLTYFTGPSTFEYEGDVRKQTHFYFIPNEALLPNTDYCLTFGEVQTKDSGLMSITKTFRTVDYEEEDEEILNQIRGKSLIPQQALSTSSAISELPASNKAPLIQFNQSLRLSSIRSGSILCYKRNEEEEEKSTTYVSNQDSPCQSRNAFPADNGELQIFLVESLSSESKDEFIEAQKNLFAFSPTRINPFEYEIVVKISTENQGALVIPIDPPTTFKVVPDPVESDSRKLILQSIQKVDPNYGPWAHLIPLS